MANLPNYPTAVDPTETSSPNSLAIGETDNTVVIENTQIRRLRSPHHHQSWTHHPSSFGMPPAPLLPQGDVQPAIEAANSQPVRTRVEEEIWPWISWNQHNHNRTTSLQEGDHGIMDAWRRRNEPGSRYHIPSIIRNIRLPPAELDARIHAPVDEASPPRDGPTRRQEWIENRLVLHQLEADQNIPLTDRTFIIYDPVEDTPDDDPFFTPITVDDPEEECGICGQVFGVVEVVVRLPCRHCFHRECIFTWFVRYQRETCPFCRQVFGIQRMPLFAAPVLSLSLG